MSVEIPLPGGESPRQLSAGESTTTVRRSAPISHGAGVSSVLHDENDLYDTVRTDIWGQLDIEPDEEKLIRADIDYNDSNADFVWAFKSSGYKAGARNRSGNWKQWFKYHLMLRKVVYDSNGDIDTLKVPPVSCHVLIEPQKEEMTYNPDKNDGQFKKVDLPYGEGSRISIQTTYVEQPSTVVRRGIEALRDLLGLIDQERMIDSSMLKDDSQRIWKLEAHLRFDIDLKPAVVRAIEQSERLIDFGGGSEIQTWKERMQEGWLEARTESDRWQWLGLEPAATTVVEDGEETRQVFLRELKVYQMNNWFEKSPSEWQHHPKIEASLGGGHNPHIDEWHSVLDRLRELVLAHCEWAGITDDDLVGDPHFDPASQPTFEYDHPEGRREDLRQFFNRYESVIYGEESANKTKAVYDILSYITEQADYGVTYDELETITGYTRSNINYHVNRLVDAGILETQGNPAIIGFSTVEIQEIAKEAIDNIASRHGDETLGKRRIEREKRAKAREQAREEGEAQGTHDPRDEMGPEQRGGDEDDDSPPPFAYLKDWGGTPQMMVEQLVDDDHPRTENDIRVRQFEEDPGVT